MVVSARPAETSADPSPSCPRGACCHLPRSRGPDPAPSRRQPLPPGIGSSGEDDPGVRSWDGCGQAGDAGTVAIRRVRHPRPRVARRERHLSRVKLRGASVKRSAFPSAADRALDRAGSELIGLSKILLATGNSDSAKAAPTCDRSHGRGFFVVLVTCGNPRSLMHARFFSLREWRSCGASPGKT